MVLQAASVSGDGACANVLLCKNLTAVSPGDSVQYRFSLLSRTYIFRWRTYDATGQAMTGMTPTMELRVAKKRYRCSDDPDQEGDDQEPNGRKRVPICIPVFVDLSVFQKLISCLIQRFGTCVRCTAFPRQRHLVDAKVSVWLKVPKIFRKKDMSSRKELLPCVSIIQRLEVV